MLANVKAATGGSAAGRAGVQMRLGRMMTGLMPPARLAHADALHVDGSARNADVPAM